MIDSFGEVVRFNEHPFGGEYAEDVGSRVTIWFASACVPSAPAKCRKVWYRPYGLDLNDDWEQIPRETEIGAMMLLGQKDGWPSTGLMALVCLLQEFPVVHTAGWWAGETFDNYLWDTKNDLPPGLSHRADLERSLYRKWVDQGRVVPID